MGSKQFIDQPEECFNVGHCRRSFEATRATEQQPDAFQPAPWMSPATLGKCLGQHAGQMLQTLLTIGR